MQAEYKGPSWMKTMTKLTSWRFVVLVLEVKVRLVVLPVQISLGYTIRCISHMQTVVPGFRILIDLCSTKKYVIFNSSKSEEWFRQNQYLKITRECSAS